MPTKFPDDNGVSRIWARLKSIINASTTIEVDTDDWIADTTSQAGSTLYKKSIAINNLYISTPTIDIGVASGNTLPTTDEQAAYDLLQYATVDSSEPSIYLYASEIPENTFYIKVDGVD